MPTYDQKIVSLNSMSLDEELQRNESLTREDTEILEKWCENQLHLPTIEKNELSLFLHCNNYNFEAAKERIDLYFTMRAHLPQFFAHRDPVENKGLLHIFEHVFVIPLKERTKEGYKIIIAGLLDGESDNYIYDDAIKFLNMVLDICIYEEGSNDGYILIIDLNGSSMKHMTQLSWPGLANFFQYSNKGTPIRWKGIHYINTASILAKRDINDFVQNRIVKRFFEKIYYHSSIETAKNMFPFDAMPNEMGGKAGPIRTLNRSVVEKLKSYRDWFLKFDKRSRIDNTLRSGEFIDINTLIRPSTLNFKNLDFD